jgi:hypothetical protein
LRLGVTFKMVAGIRRESTALIDTRVVDRPGCRIYFLFMFLICKLIQM